MEINEDVNARAGRRDNLNEKAREARREYHRRWQQANRDKVKAYQMAYWERRAAELETAEAGQQETGER